MTQPTPDRPAGLVVLRSMQSVIESILADYLDLWSHEQEPDGRYPSQQSPRRLAPGWHVFTNDNTPSDWTPDAVVHIHEHNFDGVTAIASPLEQKLATQAMELRAALDAAGSDLRLQENAHVILHFEIDAEYTIEHEDGYFFNAPMPAEGATFRAGASIHLSESAAELLGVRRVAGQVQS